MPEQPNPATPEVKVTLQEAASFSQTKSERFAPRSESTQKLHQRWRDLKEKGANPKDILRDMRESGNPQKISPAEAEDIKSRMGGGNASLEGDPPVARLSPDASPLEKQNFEYNSRLIDEISSLSSYADILDEATKTKKDPATVIRERVARGDNSIKSMAGYNEARNMSLDALISSPATKILFPDIDSYASEAQRRNHIEEVLAKDPKLRAKTATALRSIANDAQNLPEIEKDDELKTAENNQQTILNNLNVRLHQVIESIKADGIELDESTQAEIISIAQSGATPDQVINKIRGSILNNGAKFPNASKFAAIPELKTRVDEAFAKWDRVKPAATTNKGATPNPAAETSANELFAAYQNLEKEYGELMKVASDNREEYDRYQYFSSRYSPSSSESSPIGQRLAKISELSTNLGETARLIAEKKAKPNRAESDSVLRRRRAEADLQERLENIIPNAIIDTIDERYDAAFALEQQALSAEAIKATETDEKSVLEGISKSFIELNPNTREKIIHADNINRGMRLAAYQGEEGIKRYIASFMKFESPKLDTAGVPLADGSGKPIMESFDAFNGDLSTLSEQQKLRLDAMYATHGEKLRNKLFRDAFAAQTKMDRLRSRKWPGGEQMGLKKHEWSMLEANFSGKLEEALTGSKEASEAIKKLESQGIKADFKLKWLIFVLLGIGVLGAAGALGIAAAKR